MEFPFPVILDGGMGTMLQEAGLSPGEQPEVWNITRPEKITAIHKAYLAAGAQVLTANTFGANRLRYPAGGAYDLREIIAAGMRCVKNAIAASCALHPAPYAACDIGPTGKLLEPMGELSFDEAVAIFRETASIGAAHGAQIFLIETMTDLLELKAAVIACKEAAPEIPIFASFSVEENGRLLTGATAACAAMTLESLGVAAAGVNCGAGPERVLRVLPEILAACGVPVLAQPNAGLPGVCEGKSLYSMTPDAFARQAVELYSAGADLLGGCCGTTPAHIAALCKALETPPVRQVNRFTGGEKFPAICSGSQIVSFEDAPILIGERINPTGKPTFQKHLRAGDWDYILNEAAAQEQAGAHVLDINLGLPGIDELAAMAEVLPRLQAATPLPLQIDSANPAVLEAALRRYHGKPLINSVNGKEESMRAVFPLLRKYGGAAVALLLDENGIPDSIEGRIAIAEKIYATAADYGLGKSDLLIDALTMAIGAGAAQRTSAETTLETVAKIRAMGGFTVLGVSNISFGLPQREVVTAAFFTMAMQKGLNAAILNPKSASMMGAYHSCRLLMGKDANAAGYLRFAGEIQQATQVTHRSQTAQSKQISQEETSLAGAILRGRAETARQIAQAEAAPPLELIQQSVIPALDEVGKRFGTGELFLPQLLQSAAAAKTALDVLQEKMRAAGGAETAERGTIVLATVQGDVHDIGKNIVKTLMETYHFKVIDLGKDVPTEEICGAVVRHHAPLCGLSALMTTTLPAMEETIGLLKQRAPWCKIMVGGAVLTEEYAKRIGADAYCADAASSAAAANKLLHMNSQ